MDRKTVLIFTFVVISLMMIGFSTILFLKLKRPEVLGLPPIEQDTDVAVKKTVKKLELEPTFEITANKLNDFKEKTKERNEFEKRADSLAKELEKLKKQDSAKDVKIAMLNDSIIPNKEQLINNSQTYSDFLQDSIERLARDSEKFQAEAEIARKEKSELEKYLESEVDSVEVENYKQFAKIYNGADPAKVAKILENMDEKEAATILKFMRVKNAGKVIELLPNNKATLIMQLANKK